MSPQEIQKRNEKAQQLRVIAVDSETYFVESSEGKICYRVIFNDAEETCTCGDFVKNRKTNPNFKCKHILSLYGCLANDSIIDGQMLQKHQPRLNESFITTIEGKDFIKYPGLLDYAHQKGLSSIEVEILQIPTADNGNFAICKAVVTSKIGETFSDIGDANPQNCNSKVSKHLLRMASTRSIARALRSYTNVGMTALEELGDFNEVIGDNTPARKTAPPKRAAAKPRLVEKKPEDESSTKDPDTKDADTKDPNTKDAEPPVNKEAPNIQKSKPSNTSQKQTETKQNDSEKSKMSEAQKRAIYNLSRRRGISVEDLEKMATDTYGTELESLTASDASALIRNLQTAA